MVGVSIGLPAFNYGVTCLVLRCNYGAYMLLHRFGIQLWRISYCINVIVFVVLGTHSVRLALAYIWCILTVTL
jgi:hypothetical protein